MNVRGMLTSLITIGTAGAAIYGITKGVQNGTFQRLPQTVSNALNKLQQGTNTMQNMASNMQQIANPLQGGTTNENSQQQTGNNNQSNQL